MSLVAVVNTAVGGAWVKTGDWNGDFREMVVRDKVGGRARAKQKGN